MEIVPQVAANSGTFKMPADRGRRCGKANVEVGQRLCQASRDWGRLVAGAGQTKCPPKWRRPPQAPRMPEKAERSKDVMPGESGAVRQGKGAGDDEKGVRA